ncbi:PepSY-associated TM helix domain-containing protein [Novosphingobium sp. JCM 18896]|uniref:PepSY-associated TM helix domain-containing protein n=1 Tax=Novosphingobium sp. JCM 18896 TaxID=2989731 RepID=UPI002222CC93|nr:PepSY-associated TM helix domain-containing protein [Novosphingobium sp. JCM 18896]MCW1429891.1 PepSY-associated TM helix domain-containing protein [Novosphingobium sp. JCM 18896]
MPNPTPSPKPRAKSRKSFWLKQIIMWHWMSSALSLIGLVLFAVTGFTLNHAADIEGKAAVTEHAAQVPASLQPLIAPDDKPDSKKVLPPQLAAWVAKEFKVDTSGEAEWSFDTVYLPLARPGGDAWVSLDRETGEATSEDSDRGVIAYLNDLHKGRNSGGEWSWFIDVFAFACLVFALTGLVLLWLHAHNRKSTWPLVAGGFVIPAAIALVFIH